MKDQISSELGRRIGRNIKKFRKRFNYSQEELGDMVGITGGTISNYEKGKGVSLYNLPIIAKALDIDEEELYSIESRLTHDRVVKFKTIHINKVSLNGKWYWAETESVRDVETDKFRVSEFRVTDMDTADRIDPNTDTYRTCRQMVISMVRSLRDGNGYSETG